MEDPTAKARLVTKGFQEEVGDDAVDASTVTRSGVRMMLVVAVRRPGKFGRWISSERFVRFAVGEIVTQSSRLFLHQRRASRMVCFGFF